MLHKRIENIKQQLNNSQDLTANFYDINGKQICVMYIKSMTNKILLAESVITPILESSDSEISIEYIKNIIKDPDIKINKTEQEIVNALLLNEALIFVDGEDIALSIDTEQYPMRTPSEPPTSSVIKGPREGFTEDYKTNLTLIRRRFPTKHLKIDNLTLGKYTKTKIGLIYLDDVANKKVVKEIKQKLSKIKIDGIVDSFYLVDFLMHKNSLFKQIGTAEKPDIIAGKILEGRVAILVAGSPIVLTVPFVYFEDLQNSNDYYTNFWYATLVRFIRFLGLLIATVVPGIFLSLRLYHYQIVPLKYLVTIANSTQNLPFTPFLELLFILILFQILYEVSLRLPQYLGLATSIVGALILGDTGVKAGLISPPTVIIIALSLISIYTVPEQAPQFSVLRLGFIFVGACLGILGVVALLIYVINYLNHQNLFGAPFFAPYTPRIKSDLKDGFFMSSIKDMQKRPQSFRIKNKIRLKNEDDD